MTELLRDCRLREPLRWQDRIRGPCADVAEEVDLVNEDEKAAVRAALRRMFEENINPYGLVAESLARGVAREKDESEAWSRFLPGHSGVTATVEILPPSWGSVRIGYAPSCDADLGPGEIVRTWVPGPADRRGSYGSALIVGREDDDRLYAVRLSTVSHDGPHRLLPIGAGPKDSHGRWSWVDVDRILSVHVHGVRRTGFVIDRDHFIRVADELYGHYGWPMED